MRLHLDDIQEEGLTLPFSASASSFDELNDVEDDRLSFIAPIEGQIVLRRHQKQVEIRGVVKTRIQTHCSRCLCECPQSVSSEFALQGMVIEHPQLPEDEGDIELNKDELERVVFDSEEIDLAPLVAEQVLLAMPLQVICNQDCKGICHKCGIDLNQQSCDCHLEIPPGPFDALKNFKIDN